MEKRIASSTKNEPPAESRTPSTAASGVKPNNPDHQRRSREIAQAMVDSLNRHTANLPD